jgi:hypothetical protein
MAIKRYTANKDNTITNAFKANLTDRGTGSNMGASDVVEVFSIYAQAPTGSYPPTGTIELARALVQFPVHEISSDRDAGTVPASGSVSFYLRMFNARHGFTLPRNYTLEVSPISKTWEEGHGLDMEDYSDLTYDDVGSNWVMASSGSAWSNAGGDYHTTQTYSASFDKGDEDLEIEITELVEEWIAGTKSNYGVGVALKSSHETADRSYYTKKFFARSSEFFFKRPHVEARWDSAKKDDRGNFYSSSSLASPSDNLNTLYLYNVVRGRLQNIPAVGDSDIYVEIYDEEDGGSRLSTEPGTPITGGWVSAGIYSASVAIQTTASYIYDRWVAAGQTDAYHTGTIKVNQLQSSNYNPSSRYVTTVSNLKSSYSRKETARFRSFVREKDWKPTIYTVANSAIEHNFIESGSFKVFRVIDELDVVSFGTGSDLHTQLSFDQTGSYFDLDISILEAGYAYGVKFSYYDGSIGDWVEQPEVFKFRVEE